MIALQIGYSSPAESGIMSDLGLSMAEVSVLVLSSAANQYCIPKFYSNIMKRLMILISDVHSSVGPGRFNYLTNELPPSMIK